MKALDAEESARVGLLFEDRASGLSFRDELRAARAALLQDGERYEDVILVLERLGAFVRSRGKGLAQFGPAVAAVAEASPLSEGIPAHHPEWHIPFAHLYCLVRSARNQAVHEGAYARHLGNHAAELAVVLEDALMSTRLTVRDFMVTGPTTAADWEPLSFVRQKMLLNAFSFLPVWMEVDGQERWWLVSDRNLSRYLRGASTAPDSDPRDERLRQSLGDATRSEPDCLKLEPAPCRPPKATVQEIICELDHRPVLVCAEEAPDRLLGILTAFDLL